MIVPTGRHFAGEQQIANAVYDPKLGAGSANINTNPQLFYRLGITVTV